MTDTMLHSQPAALKVLLSKLDATHPQHDLARLCSADFGGRRIGTDGHNRASAWLAARMDELGLVSEPFDFALDIPVLALSGAPTFAIQDVSGSSWQYLTHRRDFAEHPASADCPQSIIGQAHRWLAGADPRGAWIVLTPYHQTGRCRHLGRSLPNRERLACWCRTTQRQRAISASA